MAISIVTGVGKEINPTIHRDAVIPDTSNCIKKTISIWTDENLHKCYEDIGTTDDHITYNKDNVPDGRGTDPQAIKDTPIPYGQAGTVPHYIKITIEKFIWQRDGC